MRHMSLLSAIHQHYAWPDPNSWDNSFNNEMCAVELLNFQKISLRYRVME